MGNAEERHGGVSLFPLQQRDRPRARVLRLIATSFVLFAATSFYYLTSFYGRASQYNAFDIAKQCTINNLHSNLSFLDPAVPIAADEFLERRDRLARALVESKVDAFVLEPGYTFQYYGNISQTDWEPWEPEERPFLMLILPEVSPAGIVSAKTAFLSPHFEEGRVRMLGIPSRDAELDIVIWEEHWNPYDILLKSCLFDGRPAKLMVDEEIRDFIVRGLDSAGFQTVGLNAEIELVRQRKSSAEVELLRAVNTGTVAAVRSMRPCLLPGLTEDEVTEILNSALISINFGLFFNIVLFEEHGALPHGGFVTGWKKLTHESMVVIDVGAHYLGYSSDICRSFLIDPPRQRDRSVHPADPELRAEKFKVWQVVLDAQTAAAAAFRPNNTAASVDIAARTIIENAGYGYGFTHRLGHGIGIKAHESPYLNKWNKAVLLQPGMTFTNEPGIYLENRFGVRHEDIYLVKESGEAELLTGRRATGPYDP
ncbi:metallopeptidase family M24 [Colletotrichum higginsianum]|uniref:Metallopeptidase family M24 n=1 Tax=Colletotrichum higginsianum (strain IMI 349063) TaxID=759273 RepID=H1VUW7_COLHI|nr:metallopeptidase family M24 [Colletotrichum higginsianum]